MGKQGQVALQEYKPTAEDPLCRCGAPKHDHKADGRPADPKSDCAGFSEPKAKSDAPDAAPDAAPRRVKRHR